MHVKFSICIPNYNYANYIGETIESVLNQTYHEFTIVIVDNASTDNSWEIIESYAAKDNRIKTYRNEYNVGFAPNLDKAAQKAQDEFIIMLSADDTMKPNALAEYAAILSINNINLNNLLLTSATDIIDSNGTITNTYAKNHFHNIPDKGKYKNLFNDLSISDYDGLSIFNYVFPRFKVPGPFNATMYSKVLYEKVGGYSSLNLIGPDSHFAYKCLLSGAELIFIDKPLFNYRIHQNGQLQTTSKNKNINLLIDRYIFSNAYSDEQLMKANVTRLQYINATINVDCITGGLRQLKDNNWVYAFRHFMFAWAAYPELAIKHKKMYAFALLLMLGPLGVLILQVVYKHQKDSKKKINVF